MRLTPRFYHVKRAYGLVTLIGCGFFYSPAAYSAKVTAEAIDVLARDHWTRQFNEQATFQGWKNTELAIHTELPDEKTLLPCGQPLQIKHPLKGLPLGKQRLRLYCPDEKTWSVSVQGDIIADVPVLMVTSLLPIGHIVTAKDLEVRPIAMTYRDQYSLVDPSQAIGMKIKRLLRPGQPFSAQYLEMEILINKGDEVHLVAQGDVFSASIRGIALESGYAGQQIQVRNLSSGRIISASVIDRNTVHTYF